jgi:hypothetical protein
MSEPVTKVKKVFKVKKDVVAAPVPEPIPAVVPAAIPAAIPEVVPVAKAKKTFKVKKADAVAPVPAYTITDPESRATEAFLLVRDYYESKGTCVTEEDIQWYKEELERERKEVAEFWEDCSVTKACLDAFTRGETEEIMNAVYEKAKKEEKKKPLAEGDLGEKPPFGTPEFWAWARKSKQLRIQKEAAAAAGGDVKKGKKAKA